MGLSKDTFFKLLIWLALGLFALVVVCVAIAYNQWEIAASLLPLGIIVIFLKWSERKAC